MIIIRILFDTLCVLNVWSQKMNVCDSNQAKLKSQARNQEFLRAGEFSWYQGTFIKIHLPYKKEKPCREKITNLFAWKLFKNCIFNEKFYPQMTTIRAFFPKLGHFFPIFQKGQGRPPPLPPSSYAPESVTLTRITGVPLIIQAEKAFEGVFETSMISMIFIHACIYPLQQYQQLFREINNIKGSVHKTLIRNCKATQLRDFCFQLSLETQMVSCSRFLKDHKFK